MVVSAIAGLVSQIIPAEHVSSFLEQGHYFAPCSSFVDLMEFRYGYCLFNSAASTPAEIQGCVRKTFDNAGITDRIMSASISCWSRQTWPQTENCALWQVYGRGAPAIQVTVEAQTFFAYIKGRHPQCTGGHVTYANQPSATDSEMCERGLLNPEQNEDWHLFFHKHGFYGWEKEFRIVIFTTEPTFVPISDSLVESIIISPCERLTPNTERALRERFGARVLVSALRF